MRIAPSLILFLTVGLAVWSGCRKEDEPLPGASCRQVRISFQLDGQDTRSVLSPSIEQEISQIALWAYDQDGKLEDQICLDWDRQTSLLLELSPLTSHHLYAVANMGAVPAPENEKEAASFCYRLDSYDKIRENGLPMSGRLPDLPPDQTEAVLKLERLFAKVSLTLDKSEITPDEVGSIRVNQCNRSLYPFREGGSRAGSPSDIFSGEEGEPLPMAGWEGKHLVFYVPENRQGTLLPDNTRQEDKTPEQLSGQGLAKNAALCTYIEVNAILKNPALHHGIEGPLTYRFYLGSDNTSDFNVCRNQDYQVRLGLTWNGQFLQENWRVDASGIQDHRNLHVQGIQEFRMTATGPETRRGDYVNIMPGQAGGISIRYSMDSQEELNRQGYNSEENLFTIQNYNRPHGWCLSKESERLLQENGIRWNLEQARIQLRNSRFEPEYIDPNRLAGFYTRDKENDGKPISGEDYQIYLIFHVPFQVRSGLQLPIDICTKDQSIQKRILLNVYENDITFRLHSSQPLVGTAPILELAVRDPDIRKIDVAPHTGSSDLLDIEKIDAFHYRLYFKKEGPLSLSVSGQKGDLNFSYPDYKLMVYTPVLKFDRDRYQISLDGTPVPFRLAYYSSERGWKMDIARTDAEATGDMIVPSLYRKYLRPEIELLNGIRMEYESETIDCSSRHLASSLQEMEGQLSMNGPLECGRTLTLVKAHNALSGIAAYAALGLEPALPDYLPDHLFGQYLFYLSTRTDLPGRFSNMLLPGDRVHLEDRPCRYDRQRYRIAFSCPAGQIQVRETRDHYLEMQYPPQPASYQPGKTDIIAQIHDRNTGSLLAWQVIGHLDAYLHTRLGALATKDDAYTVSVKTVLDLPGAKTGFEQLEQLLKEEKELFRVPFEETGKWFPIAGKHRVWSQMQTSIHGNTLYPGEGYDHLLSQWEAVQNPGALGDSIYRLHAGDETFDYFNLWEAFSYHYVPEVTCQPEHLRYLEPFPGKTDTYYFRNPADPGADEQGRPYHLLTICGPDTWLREDFQIEP